MRQRGMYNGILWFTSAYCHTPHACTDMYVLKYLCNHAANLCAWLTCNISIMWPKPGTTDLHSSKQAAYCLWFHVTHYLLALQTVVH